MDMCDVWLSFCAYTCDAFCAFFCDVEGEDVELPAVALG